MNKKYINAVNQLKIPIIDIYDKIFKEHSDPLSLYPSREHGHLNSKGYRQIAQSILENINNN